jgi:hypothetical protein
LPWRKLLALAKLLAMLLALATLLGPLPVLPVALPYALICRRTHLILEVFVANALMRGLPYALICRRTHLISEVLTTIDFPTPDAMTVTTQHPASRVESRRWSPTSHASSATDCGCATYLAQILATKAVRNTGLCSLLSSSLLSITAACIKSRPGSVTAWIYTRLRILPCYLLFVVERLVATVTLKQAGR